MRTIRFGIIAQMNVRVRYAPSPTGLQHIGGVRTALFNYFFAKSSAGTFVLRVEDTDRERFDPRSLQDIYDTFAWLGIHWDEGPDVGGEYGPYVQSQRSDLYRGYAQQLVDSGRAYLAYDTPEELAAARERGDEGANRRFREMDERELSSYVERGISPVVRFKVPLDGSTRFEDVILGEVVWENADVHPDPILLKSDGYPTYHLANVIDDHFMRITHVLRAQEWIPSAPLHLLLYEAFGWDPPQLCHLPMVLGEDGKKLSKRHGSTSAVEFREKGYLPDALINYVMRLGWSYDDKREVFSQADLEELFALQGVSKSPAVFDYAKLEWMNGVYIRERAPERLYAEVLPFVRAAGLLGENDYQESESLLRAAIPLIQERLKYLSDAPEMVRYLFEDPTLPEPEQFIAKKMDLEKTVMVLKAAQEFGEDILGGKPDEEELEAFARAKADELGVKLGGLLMPLRVAVTGSRVSPPLFGSMRLIGADATRRRLGRALEHLVTKG
jgi:glutamyl-tRNA synthetase